MPILPSVTVLKWFWMLRTSEMDVGNKMLSYCESPFQIKITS